MYPSAAIFASMCSPAAGAESAAIRCATSLVDAAIVLTATEGNIRDGGTRTFRRPGTTCEKRVCGQRNSVWWGQGRECDRQRGVLWK